MKKYAGEKSLINILKNLQGELENRVEVIPGKGLSTNDFTDEEKNKLANISEGASTVSIDVGKTTTGAAGTSASVTNSGSDTNLVLEFVIPKGDQGTRGSTTFTGTSITGTNTSGVVFSGCDVDYAIVGDTYLNTATSNMYQCTVAGDPSTAKWAYKCCLRGQSGSDASVTVDDVLSSTSTNPVQNKVINAALDDMSGRIPSLVEITKSEIENLFT